MASVSVSRAAFTYRAARIYQRCGVFVESPVHLVLLGAIAGIIASQFVAYVVQHRGPFKQPGLTEFALSWSSFLLGGLSGGAAGWFVAHLSGYRKQFQTRSVFLAFLLPIGAEILCAVVMLSSAQGWKAQ